MSPSGARPVLVAWSGGKDAACALERLRADPAWRVAGIVTTVTSGYERIAIHGVRRALLETQAARLGLPLYEAQIPPQASNAQYETAFAQALARAREAEPELDAIAFGDLFLADVRAYREALLARLGWHGVYPLWGENTANLARTMIARGYRAVLTCVDTQQLDAAFCGREFDSALLDALPSSCDPCGENGEFHTLVYAAPLWQQPIALTRGERVLRDERFQYIDLIESA